MNFNKYSHLEGKHAFLSASKYHWINYDEEKLEATYRTASAAARGSELHAFAAEAIRLGMRLDPGRMTTLNMYVNDSIGFRMTPEQILYYSDNCFGTADAISFRDGMLRIFDLKTGVTKASPKQLEVYAALFCMEYHQKPHQTQMELRIYQEDEVHIHIPDPDFIVHIMDKIVMFDRKIEMIKAEVA